MRSTVSEILTQVGLLLLLVETLWHLSGQPGDDTLVGNSLPSRLTLLLPKNSVVECRGAAPKVRLWLYFLLQLLKTLLIFWMKCLYLLCPRVTMQKWI